VTSCGLENLLCTSAPCTPCTYPSYPSYPKWILQPLPLAFLSQDLAEAVAEEYGRGVRIKYKDGEGDLVTITSDKGLALALHHYFASRADVWHLYLFTAQSPTKQGASTAGGGGLIAGGTRPSSAESSESSPKGLKQQPKGKGIETPWDEGIGMAASGRTGGKGGLNAKAKQRQQAAAMRIQAAQRGHLARVEVRVLREHLQEERDEEERLRAAHLAAQEKQEEAGRGGDGEDAVAVRRDGAGPGGRMLLPPRAAGAEVEDEEDGQEEDGAMEEGEGDEMSMEDLAALDVQRVVRGHRCRRRLRFEEQRAVQQHAAAALITRVGRGHLARKVYLGLLLVQLQIRSATTIQRIARGNAVRKHDRERRAREADCLAKALRIQSVVRGHWARVYAERLRFMGAGGVVLNRYKIEPVKGTRKEKEERAAKEKARAEGKTDHGLQVEYVAATCLKTNRQVLIRYVFDVNLLNKELALLNFIGPDHVSPLFEVHSDKKLNQHAIVFPKPDVQLRELLATAALNKKDIDSATKTEIVVGVAQALQAIHSKRVAVCNLSAANICKFGPVWKVLGLESAHKEGEIFGSTLSIPGAPPSVTGITWAPETSCDSPESVAAWCAKTQDALKASTRLDLWNFGVLTYRILSGRPLFKDRKVRSSAQVWSHADVRAGRVGRGVAGWERRCWLGTGVEWLGFGCEGPA
jgi:hypothetical protein